MAWAEPEYTKSEVDRAGSFVKSYFILDITDGQHGIASHYPGGLGKALEVVNNWRSSHNFPLNTFQMTLRNRANRVDPSSLVAQRIKRMRSIVDKLRTRDTMTLSQMQDIGGCRAIVSNTAKVRELTDVYTQGYREHKLVRMDDYIASPKDSGYRSVHLIYRYRGDADAYWNLKVEIQLRSRHQHAWATAVETVGTMTRQALKASIGETEWLHFFQLMSSYIALQEDGPLVPNTPSDERELLGELRKYATQLQVETRLRTYRSVMQLSDAADAKYYLLMFSPREDSIVVGFRSEQLDLAMSKYLDAEKGLSQLGPGSEAVLVSVASLSQLQAAFPNYFADTDEFLKLLNKALS